MLNQGIKAAVDFAVLAVTGPGCDPWSKFADDVWMFDLSGLQRAMKETDSGS
jgi:hypothetical protein